MSKRRILRVTGSDSRDFLQGLISNDVQKLDEGLVYAALLSPQGKYLADFFLVPAQAVLAEGVVTDASEAEGTIFIDVAEELAEGLLKRLTLYRLRADVQIATTEIKVQRGTGPRPKGALQDPRHPAMGWRLYGADQGDDGTDWDAIRVAHCIPEFGAELGPESYILEAGFEALHGVDFRKGCYVGQEVTARMKHKTELRKGLKVVEITGSAPIGAEVTANGKPVGHVFTQSGGRAIAHLRFERAKGEMQAGTATLRWSAT